MLAFSRDCFAMSVENLYAIMTFQFYYSLILPIRHLLTIKENVARLFDSGYFGFERLL